MTIQEIIKGIKNKSIIVNYMGHKLDMPSYNSKHWYEDFNLLKLLKTMQSPEANYNKCTFADGSSLFFKSFDIKVGENLLDSAYCNWSDYLRCALCGRFLIPILYSENEIRFVDVKTFVKGEYNLCECADVKDNGFIEAIINVNGTLCFCNFFRIDKLDHPGKDFYNINYLSERYNLMQDSAKINVGYGQCDDCSGYLYRSKANDKIIIFKREPKKSEVIDFDYIGKIIFDVWSWRCADAETIKKYYKNNYTEEDYDRIGSQYFEVDMKPGKYLIKHYDEFLSNNSKIWSIIEKIN